MLDSSGSVYGILLASSLIAALSYKERGDAWVMIGALVASEVVFALAHALSALLGGGRVRGALPGWGEVRGALRYEGPVLQAAWPTVGLLLVAAVRAFFRGSIIGGLIWLFLGLWLLSWLIH